MLRGGQVPSGLIQSTLGYKTLASAREELAVHNWEDTAIPFFRYALIASTIPATLARFYPGDDVPDRFNRHAVAHHPSPTQFTTLNALVGLILVTALARELQELARSGLLPNDESE